MVFHFRLLQFISCASLPIPSINTVCDSMLSNGHFETAGANKWPLATPNPAFIAEIHHLNNYCVWAHQNLLWHKRVATIRFSLEAELSILSRADRPCSICYASFTFILVFFYVFFKQTLKWWPSSIIVSYWRVWSTVTAIMEHWKAGRFTVVLHIKTRCFVTPCHWRWNGNIIYTMVHWSASLQGQTITLFIRLLWGPSRERDKERKREKSK